MFPSVILTFLLEVRLVSGAVHQRGDLVSGRQVHPAHGIVRLYQRGPYWFLRNAVCLSLLEKPAFILSILVDQCRAILNSKILLSHSPWHWTAHLVRMCHPQDSWIKITISLILIAAQKHRQTIEISPRLQLSQTKDAKSQQNYFIIRFIVN